MHIPLLPIYHFFIITYLSPETYLSPGIIKKRFQCSLEIKTIFSRRQLRQLTRITDTQDTAAQCGESFSVDKSVRWRGWAL